MVKLIASDRYVLHYALPSCYAASLMLKVSTPFFAFCFATECQFHSLSLIRVCMLQFPSGDAIFWLDGQARESLKQIIAGIAKRLPSSQISESARNYGCLYGEQL